ncbi:SAM-dependent chlorinase/fluorinase [bacterium]|nr:SAM-dependent chlorinase/fluorinase [bacterium]
MKYYKYYFSKYYVFCFFALSCIMITLLMIGCGTLKRGSLKTEIDGKTAKVINGEIIGHIDTIDEHGNAVTNIPENICASLEWQIGDLLEVEFTKSRQIVCQYVKNYSDVPVGDYLVRFNSDGIFKIAINQGYLVDKLKLEKSSKVIIRKVR